MRFERDRTARVCFVLNGRNTAVSGSCTPKGAKNSSCSSRAAACSNVSPTSTFPPASFHSPAYRMLANFFGVVRSLDIIHAIRNMRIRSVIKLSSYQHTHQFITSLCPIRTSHCPSNTNSPFSAKNFSRYGEPPQSFAFSRRFDPDLLDIRRRRASKTVLESRTVMVPFTSNGSAIVKFCLQDPLHQDAYRSGEFVHALTAALSSSPDLAANAALAEVNVKTNVTTASVLIVANAVVNMPKSRK